MQANDYPYWLCFSGYVVRFHFKICHRTDITGVWNISNWSWKGHLLPPPDNKSRGCCCRNSRPTVINPDYNMTKQRYITCIYDKIRSKSPPNRATSPTCLHCDATHLSLLLLLYISRREGSECARNIVRHVKVCGQLMHVEWFVAIKIIYVESSITINISESLFVMYKSQV